MLPLFLSFLTMINKELIQDIVEKVIEGTPQFLVGVSIHPGNKIIVEIDSDENIGIDDCIALSRKIESHFDRDVEDFELEVGSAGLTSPLRITRQYQKYIGNEVEVLTKDGRKLHGTLKSCNDSEFIIVIEKMVKTEESKRKIKVEEEFSFLYEDVKHTKYLIGFK